MRVETLASVDLRMGEGSWDFAARERRHIDEHWTAIAAGNPRLWNGEVLICTGASVENALLTARFARTDYASFVAWRDWGWPDRSVMNCFGTPAVFSSDGALVFGVMAAHTLNAGLVYPPSGSLEPSDVRADGTVDLAGSLAKELREEAGLDADEARPGGLVAVFDGARLAVVQALHFPRTFGEIEAAFVAHAAGQETPELDRLEAVRSASQIDSRMPGFAQEIIRYFCK